MAAPQSPAVNPYAAPKAAVDDAAQETQQVKVFSTSGRIGRARYIAYGMGFYLLIGALGAGLAAVAGPLGFLVGGAAYLVVAFLLTIQRCHDFNASGWLSLLVFVPLLNLIFWIVPGTEGRNRYGPPTPPNGALTLIIAWLMPALVILGIVAAIALPAYQGYVKRAQQMQQTR